MNLLIIFSAKYLLYILVIIAVGYFFRQSREKQKEILILAAMVFAFSYAMARIAGHFYFNPRPFAVENFTPLIPHAPNNGFPSDHTLLAAAIAAVIFRFSQRTGLLLFFFALLVGAARVWAGVHHLADIAGSFVLVAAAYFLADYIFNFFYGRYFEKK